MSSPGFLRGLLFLFYDSLLDLSLSLFEFLDLVKLSIGKFSLVVFTKIVVDKLVMSLFISVSWGLDGITLYHSTDLDIGGEFLYLCGLAGDISGVNVAFEFEQDQVVLDVLQLLIGLELVWGWFGVFVYEPLGQ